MLIKYCHAPNFMCLTSGFQCFLWGLIRQQILK